jgi:hypothetical protein
LEHTITTTDVLLILGTGARQDQAHLLARAATTGPLALISEATPTWQTPYIADHEPAATMDLPSVRRAAAALARRHHVSGVLTFNPSDLHLAAHLTADLGLPGHSTATVRALGEATSWQAPATSSTRQAPGSHGHNQISVECATYLGMTVPVAVVRTGPATGTDDHGGTANVEAEDPLLALTAPAATALLDALGVANAVTSVTMLVDDDARLRPIAVLGCPNPSHARLVRHATGVDLATAAADIARGRTPTLAPTRRRAAAARELSQTEALQFAHLATDHRLAHPDVLDALLDEPAADVVVAPVADDHTRQLRQLLAVGTTVQRCLEAVTEALDALATAPLATR